MPVSVLFTVAALDGHTFSEKIGSGRESAFPGQLFTTDFLPSFQKVLRKNWKGLLQRIKMKKLVIKFPCLLGCFRYRFYLV